MVNSVWAGPRPWVGTAEHPRKLSKLQSDQRGFAVAAHREIGCAGAPRDTSGAKGRVAPVARSTTSSLMPSGFPPQRRSIHQGFFAVREYARIGETFLGIDHCDGQILNLPGCRPESEELPLARWNSASLPVNSRPAAPPAGMPGGIRGARRRQARARCRSPPARPRCGRNIWRSHPAPTRRW